MPKFSFKDYHEISHVLYSLGKKEESAKLMEMCDNYYLLADQVQSLRGLAKKQGRKVARMAKLLESYQLKAYKVQRAYADRFRAKVKQITEHVELLNEIPLGKVGKVLAMLAEEIHH